MFFTICCQVVGSATPRSPCKCAYAISNVATSDKLIPAPLQRYACDQTIGKCADNAKIITTDSTTHLRRLPEQIRRGELGSSRKSRGLHIMFGWVECNRSFLISIAVYPPAPHKGLPPEWRPSRQHLRTRRNPFACGRSRDTSLGRHLQRTKTVDVRQPPTAIPACQQTVGRCVKDSLVVPRGMVCAPRKREVLWRHAQSRDSDKPKPMARAEAELAQTPLTQFPSAML